MWDSLLTSRQVSVQFEMGDRTKSYFGVRCSGIPGVPFNAAGLRISKVAGHWTADELTTAQKLVRAERKRGLNEVSPPG